MSHFFILPLLNGAAMFFQQKLNPSPATDPMQAKVLQFMPVVFSIMFAFFPAGLLILQKRICHALNALKTS
jgi:YidC/Oxa1 family membrane protein insertase